MSLRDLLECILYVGDKLQNVICNLEGQREKAANEEEHLRRLIRDNEGLICDNFMEQYVNNTIELEIQNDSGSEQEENKINLSSEEKTARNQMRGFSLIMKIFEAMTL